MPLNPWIQTFTGVDFDFELLDPWAVRMRDVAIALAHQPRFLGHTARPYSVAQHSVHVLHLVERAIDGLEVPGFDRRRTLRSALLHDAAEAYVADLPSPLGHMPELEGWRRLKRRVERLIAIRFDFDHPLPPVVKLADLVALATEHRDLMLGVETRPWGLTEAPDSIRLVAAGEVQAYAMFRAACLELDLEDPGEFPILEGLEGED